MKTINLWALCMVAVFVSFLGFVVENTWLSLTKGYMDNRNMCFPFLIGYGIAILLILMILGTPDRPRFFGRELQTEKHSLQYFFYFTGVMLCVCTGEIVLGKFVEKTCHIYWWDYSKIPLHITRYTSIPTSTLFSCGITLFMDVFLERLYLCFLSWDAMALNITATGMLILLTADFLYNACQMYRKKSMLTRWRIDTTESRLYRRMQIRLRHITGV